MGTYDRRHRVRTVGSALVIATCGTLPAMLTGALAVQVKRELGLTDRELGVALAAFFATSGIAAVWLGRLADRYGWRRSVRIAASNSAVVLIGIATVAHSLLSLAVLLAMGGLSHALAAPSGNLALAREVPTPRQGVLFGIKQSAVPIAAMVAGLSVPVVALTIGWRWAYVFPVVLPVLAVVAIPSVRTAEPVSDQVPEPAPLRTVDPGLLLVTIGVTLANITVSSLATFLVVSSVAAGLSVAIAGALVSAGSVASLFVRVISGWVTDRRGIGGFRAVPALLFVGSTGFAMLALHEPVWAFPGAILAYGAGWGWQGLFHFGIVANNPGSPASATGIARVGLMAGSTVGPILFGQLSQQAGYSAAWWVIAATALCAAVLVSLGARMLNDAHPAFS